MSGGPRKGSRRQADRAAPDPHRRDDSSADVAWPFDDLFEAATDIILVSDADGRILAANRAAREFAGYAPDDLRRGLSLRDILPADEYEAAIEVTRRALAGEPFPEVLERESLLRDGSRRVLEVRSNVVRQKGKPHALQTIARDVTEKRDAAAFQASLLQVSQALLTAPHLDELGRVVCEEARRILRVDGAYLWLRRDDELVGVAASGYGAGKFIGVRRPLQGSTVGEMYRSTDVLVVNDFSHSLYSLDEATAAGVQAMMAVPLRRGAFAVGVLVFTDNTSPRRFNRTLRERAVILGAQTTVAIEGALAREKEEEEGRESAVLLRVAREIRESLEEAEVLPRITRSAREVLQCEWSLVSLWDASAEAFRVAAMEGWPAELEDEVKAIDFQRGSLDVVNVLLGGRSAEVLDASGEELYRRWGVGSFLALPMVRTGRVIGSLAVGWWSQRGGFTTWERRVAEGIAAQAAVAVENARLVEALRRANTLKSEFLSTMSHELRTPLSAILGYAELMRDGAMGPVGTEQGEVLGRMLLNGNGLLELINMTLDVNRLEAGRVSLDASEFALEDLLGDLENEFSVRASSKPEVVLSWPKCADVPPLYTDRGKLRTIVRNLVDNALKFTARGSVEVSVRWDSDLERVYVSVRDTGTGIAEAARGRIFEMFQQIEGTRSGSRGGVGLGLYLVRRYAEVIGGQVRLESTPGHGSTFAVDFPRVVSSGAA